MKPTVGNHFDIRGRAMRCRLIAVTSLAVVAAVSPALAQETKEVAKSGDWTLYSHVGQNQMCFLTSRARESEPKGQRRTGHFYITSWPKDGVKQEISIGLGTSLKANSQVAVAVGAARFKFFAQGDKAFITNSADEGKLMSAMKKGNVLVVDATSEAGAALKDKYSLIGISQGLQSLGKGCN